MFKIKFICTTIVQTLFGDNNCFLLHLSVFFFSFFGIGHLPCQSAFFDQHLPPKSNARTRWLDEASLGLYGGWFSTTYLKWHRVIWTRILSYSSTMSFLNIPQLLFWIVCLNFLKVSLYYAALMVTSLKVSLQLEGSKTIVNTLKSHWNDFTMLAS